MNTPSYDALLRRETQIRAIQELYETVSKYEKEIPQKDAEIKSANTEIYNLKKAVGNLGGDVTYDIPNALGTSFNTLMGNNGTVRLTEDLSTGRYGPGMMANNKVTLNLNNHNLTINVTGSTAAVQARGTQEITIKGKGVIDAGSGIAIMANGKDAVINLKNLISIIDEDFKTQEASTNAEELEWWMRYHSNVEAKSLKVELHTDFIQASAVEANGLNPDFNKN